MPFFGLVLRARALRYVKIVRKVRRPFSYVKMRGDEKYESGLLVSGVLLPARLQVGRMRLLS